MMRVLAILAVACAGCSDTTEEYPRIVLKGTSSYSSVTMYMIRMTGGVPKVLPGGEIAMTCPCEGVTVDLVVSGNTQGVIVALGYSDAGHVLGRAMTGARQVAGRFDVTLAATTCKDADQDGFCWNEDGAFKDPNDSDANVGPLEWQ